MSDLAVQNRESEQEVMPSFDFLLERETERNTLLAEHRAWLKEIKRERPLPKTHYRVAVYIRYFNQTRYEDYLSAHKKQFLDTLALCPNWKFVGFYVDEGSTAPNMESAPEWSRLLQDCYEEKVDLIITQKASNISKKLSELSFCTRLLAALPKPVGVYFVSEDIYVQVLVNQESRILAIRPCRAEDRDACAWCTNGSGRRKPKQITCKIFFAKVFSLMGWNLDYRYKLLGRIIHARDEWLIAFDLTATEVYQRVQKDGQKPKSSRTPVFPEGWKTQFGLPFREHQKSMQVDIFEGYAVYGLRDNIAPAASERSDEAASDTGSKSVLGGQGHES